MRVLYISSNHFSNTTLMEQSEITELQLQPGSGVGDTLEFVFLPALPVERMAENISRYLPDIVHLVAHGEPNCLEFVDSLNQKRQVDASALKSFFAGHKPKLVYINACHSASLAKALTDSVPFTIGTSQPITNQAARSGAVSFYRSLAAGRRLSTAFETSRSTVRLLDVGVETQLFRYGAEADGDPILFTPLRIVAKFSEARLRTSNGSLRFQIGVIGTPSATNQVVFFTTDRSFLSDDSQSAEEQLCSVVIDDVWNGEIWTPSNQWSSRGNILLYAAVVTADRKHASSGTTLVDALNYYYEFQKYGSQAKIPEQIKKAIAVLDKN